MGCCMSAEQVHPLEIPFIVPQFCYYCALPNGYMQNVKVGEKKSISVCQNCSDAAYEKAMSLIDIEL